MVPYGKLFFFNSPSMRDEDETIVLRMFIGEWRCLNKRLYIDRFELLNETQNVYDSIKIDVETANLRTALYNTCTYTNPESQKLIYDLWKRYSSKKKVPYISGDICGAEATMPHKMLNLWGTKLMPPLVCIDNPKIIIPWPGKTTIQNRKLPDSRDSKLPCPDQVYSGIKMPHYVFQNYWAERDLICDSAFCLMLSKFMATDPENGELWLLMTRKYLDIIRVEIKNNPDHSINSYRELFGGYCDSTLSYTNKRVNADDWKKLVSFNEDQQFSMCRAIGLAIKEEAVLEEDGKRLMEGLKDMKLLLTSSKMWGSNGML